MIKKMIQYQFLFEELVKRDFKQKYKLVMRMMLVGFFGRDTPHYTTYLFSGTLVFGFFSEATKRGMGSLRGNAGIFSMATVPKYLFLLSRNVQALINFLLTLVIYFLLAAFDGITFTWRVVCLIYPICCLTLFNIGIGMVLSALFIFFRDTQYLYDVFLRMLTYLSAIFYTIDRFSPLGQNLFLLNPIYLFIRYFRKIVIEATVPTIWFHLLMAADVVIALGMGCFMYKKYNTKFLYYI